MKHKVLAYVLRHHLGRPEVLVFAHRDFADAGLQVPAGTVEPGEAPEAAAYREVLEESGLDAQQVRMVRKLTEQYEPEFAQQRHVFEQAPVSALPDRWTHTVRGSGEGDGLVFEYYRVAVTPAPTLAGRQERFLYMASTAETE